MQRTILLVVCLVTLLGTATCHGGMITLDTFDITGRSYVDFDFDGAFDGAGTANASSYVIASTNSGVWRTGMEFDLLAMPAGFSIESAILELNYNVITNAPVMEIHGFVGDGSAGFGDVISDNLLGALQSPGDTRIDVTQFIRNLSESGQRYAGISLRIQDDYNIASFARQAWIATKFDTLQSGPTLVLSSAAVPEPASIVLWGIGALGMGLFARRKRLHTASV